MNKPIFIAEIKTQSPFGFKSDYSFHHLMETAIQYGSWISVHTNPLWGGSYEALQYVRRNTNKPILAKGLHSFSDVQKCLDYGANHVLLVDKNNSEEIYSPDNDGYIHYVYNGRDLKTGLPKMIKQDYLKYRKTYNWICGASFIKHPHDVQKLYPNCDAFIVGEHLVEFCKQIT